MHLFPQLRKVERRFAQELVVIGVHSAKFPAERETENVRKAIQRYEIEHPVVNDREFQIWRSYAVRAWPTLMFIDPAGHVMGQHEGEASAEALEEFVGAVVQEFEAQSLMDRSPLPFHTPRRTDASPLSFPGKVLADAASGRLFVADSNHNRVVVASLEGAVQEVVSNGEEGWEDGSFAEARFNHPQGLALVGEVLYVADTENHCIRGVNLRTRAVETVAGTGGQGFERSGGPAKDVSLSSPWDLAYHGGLLYVAMAGYHQIWALDLTTGYAGPYAGTGQEALVDGLPQEAALAQPSGIATDGRLLYFADSETSSVRVTGLDGRTAVRTIVGDDLFVFGDVDGQRGQVRLQHPLGVAVHEGALLVADTYNNKVKRVHPETGRSTTFLGTGAPGLVDGPGAQARLHEPGGLSVAGGKLYIADTNNHVVRVADLATGEMATLALRGLERPG